MNKPELEDFLRCFEATVVEQNKTYQRSKLQFEADMREFADLDGEEDK